jgi:hypothetical protein
MSQLKTVPINVVYIFQNLRTKEKVRFCRSGAELYKIIQLHIRIPHCNT